MPTAYFCPCDSKENLTNTLSLKQTQPTKPQLSVVVPIYNEADNITSLVSEIRATLDKVLDYELIYVDDGSNDNSWQQLQTIALVFPKLRLIRHRHCYGQSIAILTGVKAARADWIVTLDGDGQNDPTDIKRLWAVLENRHCSAKLQLIAGLRHKRQDNWLKRLSSHTANRIRNRLLHDNILDTGCSLKLFSRQAFLALPHFNHMHRFLPALFLRGGGHITTLEVNHRPRLRGRSKYGLHNRLWVGLVDLFGVMWLQRRACVAEWEEHEH